MTAVAPDFSVLDALDFDLVCQPHLIECGRVATWVFIKSCCGTQLPFCDEHRSICLEQIREMAKRHPLQTCVYCKVVGHAEDCGRWEKL